MQGNLNSPNLYRSQFQPVSSQQGFRMMLYSTWKALEERTGAAKASVPSKKKKVVDKEMRIAVFIGSFGGLLL